VTIVVEARPVIGGAGSPLITPLVFLKFYFRVGA